MDNIEQLVVTRAVQVYRKTVQENKKIEELLKHKKFKLNDYIVNTSTTYFDRVFGVDKEKVGKVVGYDIEEDYYRVRFSKNNPYIGRKEDILEKYEGSINEIDEDLINYNPSEIKYVRKWYLRVEGSFEYTDIQIEYCPHCGRKLD